MKTPSKYSPEFFFSLSLLCYGLSAACFVAAGWLAFKGSPIQLPDVKPVPSAPAAPAAMCPQAQAKHPSDVRVTVTSNVSDGTVIPCMGGEATGLPVEKVAEYRTCRQSEVLSGVSRGCL